MKFSLFSIPLAMLASIAAAQYPPQGYQQPQQPQQYSGYQPQQYGGYGLPPQQCIGGIQPGQFPNIPDYEVADWFGCAHDWVKSMNDGASGSAPACSFYSCLQDKAAKYQRGGTMAAAGRLLTPICTLGGIGAGLVC